MKKILSVVPLVLLMCFVVGCQPQETGEPESMLLADDDIAAIRASTELFGAAMVSGDVEGLLALYTEDAVVMPPNMPKFEGKDALRTLFENMPTPSSATFTIHEIDGRGDLAYVIGSVATTYDMEGMPEPLQDLGKYIEIRVKQEDGSWPIARDIFNSDIPLPEAEEG